MIGGVSRCKLDGEKVRSELGEKVRFTRLKKCKGSKFGRRGRFGGKLGLLTGKLGLKGKLGAGKNNFGEKICEINLTLSKRRF